MSDWPLIRPQAHCTTLCLFFVVVGTVKPFRVSPVELVDYLLGKTIYNKENYVGASVTLEMGYASALGKPVYALNEETGDPCRDSLIDKIASTPEKLAKLLA
ncbi:MAG TPA: hypothetical protein VK254_04970, partial [Candidatus Bathyarchaeia archaeon]|nr:hypothetical protein [Candidatus Bathyarchaeia archaeon]